MQLITILLIVVSVLVLLSGIIVRFGSTKSEKSRSMFFLLAAIFATVWSAAMLVFLTASTNSNMPIDIFADWTFASAILIDIAFLGYVAWSDRYGKPMTIFFTIFGLAICACIFLAPDLMYKDIILAKSGNSIILNFSILSIAYATFFSLIVPVIIAMLLRSFLKTSSRRRKSSNLVVMLSFGISSIIILVFDLILPMLGNWKNIWLGPLALSTTIIAFYYTILRYRMLNLSSRWIKVFSYIVITASLAVIYMLIFLALFAILFKGSTPSTEIIILNFIMILFVMVLSPAVNELTMFVRSFFSTNQIDVVYVIKKLSSTSPKNLELRQLASFLAEHMHFEYIGIVVDGKVYGSYEHEISPKEVKLILSLGEPEKGVWQSFGKDAPTLQELELSGVAALRSANGETFGQLIVGKTLNKISFNHRDLVQIETIINLAATIIDAKMHHKKRKA